jgi:hypothetical protein
VTRPPSIETLSHEEALDWVRILISESDEAHTELALLRREHGNDDAKGVASVKDAEGDTAPPSVASSDPDFSKQFVHISGQTFLQAFEHTAPLIGAILSIWAVHSALNLALGKEAKFFDWIPIAYFFDAAHAATLLAFFAALLGKLSKYVVKAVRGPK